MPRRRRVHADRATSGRPESRSERRPGTRQAAPARHRDRVRAWFGTPAAALKTLLWLCWVLVLVTVLVTVVNLVILGVLAVAT